MLCHAKPAQAWQRSPNKMPRSDRDYHLTACENVSDVTLVIANSGETLRGLGNNFQPITEQNDVTHLRPN